MRRLDSRLTCRTTKKPLLKDEEASSDDHDSHDHDTEGGNDHDDDGKGHEHEHGHDHHHEHGKGWCSLVTLIFALSLHSFFEGLGLGVTTHPGAIFIAIAGHKWADSGFTVIFLMTKIPSIIWVTVVILVFSAFTPLGSIIGAIIVEYLGDSPVSLLVQGILLSLASGTFLYVAIVEVLAEAFETPDYKWIKFALVIILFIAMSAVCLLESD